MLCLLASVGLELSTNAAQVKFAIIGDYGNDSAGQAGVASLIRTNFQPDFIVTVGDNNYLGEVDIDRAIGKHYHSFIGNYQGTYGAGASSNRFFPAIGNHDWYSGSGYSVHTSYFTLPGNERYYDFVRGPVHCFILNSDPNEPDGNTVNSVQGRWFSNRIASSTSPWRVVIAQDGPYSSTESHAWMQWPFPEWGADIVVSGDSHQYERIMRDGFPYVINGAGGASLGGFGTPTEGSTVRYHANHGAMKVIATETNITYEFWSIANGGTLIDSFSQGPSSAQPTAPKLTVTRTNSSLRISWPTNGANGFQLQSATALPSLTWTNVSGAPSVSGTNYAIIVNRSGSRAFFRLVR